MPLVRSMILRRKVLPGGTTEQAKFNNPIRDCNLRRIAVRFLLKTFSGFPKRKEFVLWKSYFKFDGVYF